ncbi:flagellin, partial [Rhizobium sp. BR 250]
MTSILTNIAAMSALQTLRSIGQNMEATQDRVSSGLRVGEASDNAAYWSIATTMRSDNGALSAVQDALGLGAAKVDTAYAGLESSIDVVKEIKNKLVASREAGVDRAKIQEEITQLQDQLKSITDSASFSGENWLKGVIGKAAATAGDLATGVTINKQIVGSFTRSSDGNVKVQSIDIALDGSNVLVDVSGNKQGILDADALRADVAKWSDGTFRTATTTLANTF